MTIHTKPQTAQPPLEIAEAFTKAWTSSKPYLEGLTRLSDAVRGLRMIAGYGDDSHALLMYDLVTEPYGTLTCPKHFTIREGKIERDQLTFDGHKIRSAPKR